MSSDEELFDEDVFDDKSMDVDPLPVRSRSTRGRRAVVKYTEDYGSDDESSHEAENESDESDF